MTCGNDLINSQLVTPLAREAEQCAHTGNLNQTPSQTKSSQRKVKLKKHITLMIRYKLKVLTLHSLSFLSFCGLFFLWNGLTQLTHVVNPESSWESFLDDSSEKLNKCAKLSLFSLFDFDLFWLWLKTRSKILRP